MRQHPDELLGRYRLRDTAAIRRHFEANPRDYEKAVSLYRRWKAPDLDPMDRQESRHRCMAHCRVLGAIWADYACVLRAAVARLDHGLPCPPWWEGEDQP